MGCRPKEALSTKILKSDTRPWDSATLGVHGNERAVEGSARIFAPLWSDEVFEAAASTGNEANMQTEDAGTNLALNLDGAVGLMFSSRLVGFVTFGAPFIEVIDGSLAGALRKCVS